MHTQTYLPRNGYVYLEFPKTIKNGVRVGRSVEIGDGEKENWTMKSIYNQTGHLIMEKSPSK
jgi:hypothetical protein